MILFDDIVKLSRRESDTIMEEDEFAIMDLLHRVSGRVFTLLKMLVVILMMGDQLVVDRTWVVHTMSKILHLPLDLDVKMYPWANRDSQVRLPPTSCGQDGNNHHVSVTSGISDILYSYICDGP